MHILRSREWNGHTYHLVELDDGSKVELKCALEDVDVHVSELISMSLDAPSDMVDQPKVSDLSDADLLNEIKKRNLNVMVKGVAK